jgi:hypothetical protein
MYIDPYTTAARGGGVVDGDSPGWLFLFHRRCCLKQKLTNVSHSSRATLGAASLGQAAFRRILTSTEFTLLTSISSLSSQICSCVWHPPTHKGRDELSRSDVGSELRKKKCFGSGIHVIFLKFLLRESVKFGVGADFGMN